MPTTYAIPNGATVFAATTWTGVSTSSAITVTNGGNNPTGVTFAPDMVWSHGRSTAYNWNQYDTVRGVGKRLSSNTTDAESTNSANGYISAFNSDGFTASAGSTNNENWNQTSATMVAWQWKAGGTAVSNTSGSITSQVSANTTAGFSVVTYTGTGSAATVGHGLGVAPSMMIVKRRSGIGDWPVYHKTLGATNLVWLDLTNASTASSAPWNNTAPTSSVFTIGTGTDVNGSASTYVAYCWAEVAGYSKFGSYTGNGSTDGPFVYLGFRPRFVLFKAATGTTYNWAMYDSSRDTYNILGNQLAANSSSAEGTFQNVDFLSNGFKVRGNNNINESGATLIYAAFAENPFKYANAR